MILKNKKGADKIISVYWFVILFLVAGTIAYSVSIFYGDPYDVRVIETGILANNIADCLSENGKLKYKIDDELRDTFLEKCNLNFNTEYEEVQYYLEVEFQQLNFKIVKGNINLKAFSETSLPSKSIFKSEKSFYVLSQENEELTVKITSIIRKTEKNVK
tara:strand:+ start:1766 stop:2245 length:480 start_codon:yes stop_codon:yes gene_type:complete